MKISSVQANNRKKAFVVRAGKTAYEFPYSRLKLKITEKDSLESVHPDKETGNHAFTYHLTSGAEGTIPLDAVLEYNKDPDYRRKQLLYKMTLKAQKLVESSGVSKREIIRRLGSTPTQFYRLLDQTFYGKTIDQMVRLLTVLDYKVDFMLDEAA